MKLTENQALDVWTRLCEEASEYSRLPLNSRQLCEFVWGTDRMQRQALHILRQAQKKREKRIRAEREKRVRPLVRLTPAYFTPKGKWGAPFTLMIRVGNDAEIYEDERMLREEEARELRENELYDFLYGEAFDYAPTDYGDEPCDDDFGDQWWDYEDEPVEHDDTDGALL